MLKYLISLLFWVLKANQVFHLSVKSPAEVDMLNINYLRQPFFLIVCPAFDHWRDD